MSTAGMWVWRERLCLKAADAVAWQTSDCTFKVQEYLQEVQALEKFALPGFLVTFLVSLISAFVRKSTPANNIELCTQA